MLRPMPEMNTPWYAWSGTVNGNTPARYLAAWRHVRGVVKRTRNGNRIAMLWAPYAQSIPATGANQIGDYFPGASQVDLVGVSAYNFGTTGSLTWSDPGHAVLRRLLDDRGDGGEAVLDRRDGVDGERR